MDLPGPLQGELYFFCLGHTVLTAVVSIILYIICDYFVIYIACSFLDACLLL
jgi:hypothetical protein